MQQILACETDLLEYPDLFEGSTVVRRKVDELKQAAKAELSRIEAMGGVVAAIDWMKQALVASNTERLRRVESGEQVVVGVNRWPETEPSPLAASVAAIEVVDPAVEPEQVERLRAWRAGRDARAVERALAGLETVAREGRNVMEPSIACAKAGVTTGEWGGVLRAVFGEYRAPTGIASAAIAPAADDDLDELRAEVDRVSAHLGRRIKLLVGKPGLDGHSNGAEQIAVRARDCGMEVVYEGIRLTPAQIVRSAGDEGVHVVGLSILSGSHAPLVEEIMRRMRSSGLDDVPVVVGGIIPPGDAARLEQLGVAAVFTPKDFRLNAIMRRIVALVDHHGDGGGIPLPLAGRG
jgi:(2R)-ethylmalonyl-CoA mutase